MRPRYQGAGSSHVNAVYLETMENMAESSQLNVIGIAKGYQRNGKKDDKLEREAWRWQKKRMWSCTVLV